MKKVVGPEGDHSEKGGAENQLIFPSFDHESILRRYVYLMGLLTDKRPTDRTTFI